MSDRDSSSVDEQKVIGGDAPTKPLSAAEREQQKALSDLMKGAKGGDLNMRVKVYSPFRDYFDGPAVSVTAENPTGVFDILPGHHNFMSLLSPCELVVRTTDGTDMRIRISDGLLHVKTGSVVVFLDV